MDRFDAVVRGLGRAKAWVACLFILAIMVMAGVEVFTREFFNRSYAVLAEFPVFMNIAIGFFGAAWVLRQRKHIYVEVLFTRLPPAWQRVLGVVNLTVVFVVGAVLFWQGSIMVHNAYRMGTVTITTVRLPMYLPQLVVPIAGLTLALEALSQGLKVAMGKLPAAGGESEAA